MTLQGRYVWRGLGAVACLVFATMGFRMARDLKAAASDLPRELRLASADGLATEPQDLSRSLNPQDNAAPLYERAIAAFDKRPLPETSARLDALNHFLADGSESASARGSVEKWSKSMVLASEAAAKPDCDFQRVWQAGAGSEASDMKCFVKLFSARAVLQHRLRDLEIARRISIHTGCDPTLEAGLAQAECNRIWMDACWRFASRSQDPVEQLRARTLVATAEMPNLKARLSGELVLARARIHRMTLRSDESEKLDPAAEASGGLADSPLAIDAFESKVVGLYRRIYEALPHDPLDYEGVLDAANRIERSVDRQDELSEKLDRYLLPDLTDVAKRCEKIAERQRTIGQAITLLLTQGGRKEESHSDGAFEA